MTLLWFFFSIHSFISSAHGGWQGSNQPRGNQEWDRWSGMFSLNYLSSSVFIAKSFNFFLLFCFRFFSLPFPFYSRRKKLRFLNHNSKMFNMHSFFPPNCSDPFYFFFILLSFWFSDSEVVYIYELWGSIAYNWTSPLSHFTFNYHVFWVFLLKYVQLNLIIFFWEIGLTYERNSFFSQSIWMRRKIKESTYTEDSGFRWGNTLRKGHHTIPKATRNLSTFSAIKHVNCG